MNACLVPLAGAPAFRVVVPFYSNECRVARAKQCVHKRIFGNFVFTATDCGSTHVGTRGVRSTAFHQPRHRPSFRGIDLPRRKEVGYR
jgi:hypothetical protein